MCQCKIWQSILLLIIVGFTFWNSTISWLPSKWVVLVAAVGLFLHTFICRCCYPEKRRARKIRRKRRR